MPEEKIPPQITPEPGPESQPVVEPVSESKISELPPKPAGSRLKIILLSVLGLVLVAGIAFAGYKFGQKQSQSGAQPTPTPIVVATPTPDPTVDWKTYVEPNNSFTLKYPAKFYETKEHISTLLPGWKDAGVLSTAQPWNASIGPENMIIEFSIRPKKTDETLEDFISRTIKEISEEFAPKTVVPEIKRNITVDGKNALWYEGGLGPAIAHVEAYIPQTETSVVVVVAFAESYQLNNEQKAILDLMLSTFKFLPESLEQGTESWKAESFYSLYSSDGKFTISYPPNCQFTPPNPPTQTMSLIKCRLNNSNFNINPQAGGRGVEVIKKDEITLYNIVWKRTTFKSGSLSTGQSYETEINSIYYLMEVNYENFSQEQQRQVEEIIGTFKPE